MPKVTVLMPVYNSARYLSSSIESILSQTFTDSSFESGVKVHFYEPNILSFNIKDRLEGSVGKQHGYTGTLPGVVRPQLQWHLVKV